MTILVWSCYPIVWLFSEGFASFSVSFEITMYAILDVINKVIVNFYPNSQLLSLTMERCCVAHHDYRGFVSLKRLCVSV